MFLILGKLPVEGMLFPILWENEIICKLTRWEQWEGYSFGGLLALGEMTQIGSSANSNNC